MFKTNLIVGAALLISACTATQGTRIDAQQTADFKKGYTTKAEVIAALGQPYSESSYQAGVVLLYVFSKQTAQASNFVPVLNLFRGRTDSESQTCRFMFDLGDKYQRHDCSSASGTRRSALEENQLSPAR